MTSPLPWLRPFTSQKEFENYKPPTFDLVELTANKISAGIQLSNEQLREIEEDREAAAEAKARWDAMTPAERLEWIRLRDDQAARAKEARTCQHCGCDPDEHGDRD